MGPEQRFLSLDISYYKSVYFKNVTIQHNSTLC